MAKRTRSPATPWPEGFQLDGDLHRYAEEKGIPFAAIPTVWEHFENHHRAKGSVFADWRAAWRTWCLNEIKFNPGRYGRHNTPSGRAPAMDAGISIVNRLLAEEQRERRKSYDPIVTAMDQIERFERGDLSPDLFSGRRLPNGRYDTASGFSPIVDTALQIAAKEAAKKP
jgi:hypothetical protein